MENMGNMGNMGNIVILGNLLSWAAAIGMMFVSLGILRRAKSLNNDTGESLSVLREESEVYFKKVEEVEKVVTTSKLLETFKKMPDFNKLTFKHEWYLFNLQSLYFHIKKVGPDIDKDFDIFKSVEAIAIGWCKVPDDVFNDYILVVNYYHEPRVPVMNQAGEVIGHASASTEGK